MCKNLSSYSHRKAVNHVGFTAINPTWFMAVNKVVFLKISCITI
ncbi:MAG: hypothetical protein ACYSWW_26090 [Planctomycetota bacterium]|jgi:hypothetical protein